MKYRLKHDSFKDSVCNMILSKLTAVASTDYDGKTYYFCAEICRKEFERDPERHVGKHRRDGRRPIPHD